jgi:hypothetical protein
MFTVWVIKDLVFSVNFLVISKQALFLTMEHNGLMESGAMRIIHSISLHQYIYNIYTRDVILMRFPMSVIITYVVFLILRRLYIIFPYTNIFIIYTCIFTKQWIVKNKVVFNNKKIIIYYL